MHSAKGGCGRTSPQRCDHSCLGCWYNRSASMLHKLRVPRPCRGNIPCSVQKTFELHVNKRVERTSWRNPPSNKKSGTGPVDLSRKREFFSVGTLHRGWRGRERVNRGSRNLVKHSDHFPLEDRRLFWDPENVAMGLTAIRTLPDASIICKWCSRSYTDCFTESFASVGT